MTLEADESKICHPSPRAVRLETLGAEFQFMCKDHLLADLPFAGGGQSFVLSGLQLFG